LYRAHVDALNVFLSCNAGVDNSVRAGEGDVSADGSSHEGQDDGSVKLGRYESFADRQADRRRGRDDYVSDHAYHDEAKNLDEPIHGLAKVFPRKKNDRDYGVDDASRNQIHSEDDVKTQGRAADVADVERQPSQRHREGQEITQARQHLVGDVLPAQLGNCDDAPYVQLDDDADDNGSENSEAKRRPHLSRENGGLREEAGADGRGCHQKGRPQQDAHGFFVTALLVRIIHDFQFLLKIFFINTNCL
jgi:hypothetical protein